ncbi:MAG: hypothetical protein K6U03_05120 [Firmicutes bacterium]|nr:hypothetical protein [Bacillota bacterium]
MPLNLLVIFRRIFSRKTASTRSLMMTTPKIIADAKDYFNNVQMKDQKYDPVLGPNDKPAIWLNEDIMAKMRPKMEPYYYDQKKYKTYLEQLGVDYPNGLKK